MLTASLDPCLLFSSLVAAPRRQGTAWALGLASQGSLTGDESILVGVKWYCGSAVYVSFESYCITIRWTENEAPSSGAKTDVVRRLSVLTQGLPAL